MSRWSPISCFAAPSYVLEECLFGLFGGVPYICPTKAAGQCSGELLGTSDFAGLSRTLTQLEENGLICDVLHAQMRLRVGASWLQQAAAAGQSATQRVLSGRPPFP